MHILVPHNSSQRFVDVRTQAVGAGSTIPPAFTCSRVLADFDGSCFHTEKFRQIGWLLTACRPEFAWFFGGREALENRREECRVQGVGVFQKAVGASENDHPGIISEVGRQCRIAAGLGAALPPNTDEVAFTERLRTARNESVEEMMKRWSFGPIRGLFTLLLTARAKNIPFVIVTQSKRDTVVRALRLGTKAISKSGDLGVDAAWSNVFGRALEHVLIVSFDDLKKYGLAKKPSPEPYRFANYLVTLATLKVGYRVDNLPAVLQENDFNHAAQLAKLEPNSDVFARAALRLLGETEGRRFLAALPPPLNVLAVEDSETGLQACQEFTPYLVDNTVGVNSMGGAFERLPFGQHSDALNVSWSVKGGMIERLAESGVRVAFAGASLLGAADLIRGASSPDQVQRGPGHRR